MNELTDRDESGLGWVYPPQPQQTFIQEIIGMISGVIELVEGQDYIDVVFGSAQPTADWVLIETSIFNTVDDAPLNVWPGVVTSKTTTGFRLQLNGIPDSGNYFLNWSIRGVFGYYLSGPVSGPRNVASSPFTVRLPDESTLTGTVIITPEDGGAGGTFTPATVALTLVAPSATFTYTPSSYGARGISTDNDRGLIDPAEIGFICITDTYTLTGPSTGLEGVTSTDFTVALPFGAVIVGTVTVIADDGGVGGTFTPASVALTTEIPSATFTYTPAVLSIGDVTISVTNNGGLTNPGSLTYTVTTDAVVLDTFIAANGTLINGRTPSPVDAGFNWTLIGGVSGDQTIQGNAAQMSGAGHVIVDAGISDATAKVDVILATGANAGLTFRATDANNWWMLYASDTDNAIKLLLMNGGVFSQVASTAHTFNAGTSYELKVVLSGNTIRCYVDGTLMTDLNTTSSTHATATSYGMTADTAIGTLDNFRVTP